MKLTTMNINLISEEIIKPSCPTPNQLRSLRTSLFDHLNDPILMPLIFFFYSQKHTTKIGTSEILDRLKRALPKTLSIFYPLAGRVQDANYICCNDEGVPYVHAEVDQMLEDVVHKAEVSQLDILLPPYGQEGYTTLILAIQVNVFACGGLAIGLKMSHAIADGFSYLMFVKTWASMANTNHHHTILKYPIFDIWKLFPPSGNISVMDSFADAHSELMKHIPVTKWFMFRGTSLDAHRSMLFNYTNNNSNNDVHNYKTSLPSTPMVLSAFIWSRVREACNTSIKNIPNEVYHAVNFRHQVSPPDEKSYYFGNMVVNAIVKKHMVPNDVNKLSFQCEFLKQMKESIGKLISNDGFLREIQKGKEELRFMMEHYEKEKRGEIISLAFSNLKSLPLYEADFGWGKPAWVTSASLIYNNYVLLIPAAPSSKDIVAYISLSAENMAKLEDDKEFTALVSDALLVSCKL